MEKLFRQLLENNFADLPGLKAQASIPLPEPLINELISAQLDGTRNITSCRIVIDEENRVDVYVKTPLVPWTLDLKLKLFHAVDLTGSPRLRAFLENNVLIGRIASSLNAFPAGISMYDDQLTVDLERIIDSPELRRMLELVRSMEIRTEKSKLILDVQIER